MKLHEIIWKDRFIDKLEAKHGVSTDEVEEVFSASRMYAEHRKVTSRERIYMPVTGGQKPAGT